ncbi:MAG: RIP metalloprotease RseP [Thiotrichales bacterium]|nr:RIP metalloprotease RseP [Thiotrichales bacterium]
MDILYSVIAFILALGVLVTVHEFGHFWVARRLGVKVLTFSVGFGRALWSHRPRGGETEYVIAMIPLGGYVKMLDESEGEVAAHERQRAFNRKPLSTRVAVVVAGPAFNFLFAIVVYACMYMVGVDGLRPIVDGTMSGSAAERAGFRPGDELTSVQGAEVESWQSAAQAIIAASLADRRIEVDVVDADERRQERVIDLGEIVVDDLTRGQFFDRIGFAPARPLLPAIIGRLESGQPAERDGFQIGDRVLEAVGRKVEGWSDWVRIVRERPGETFPVVVERDGAAVTIRLTPDVEQAADGVPFGRIGAGVGDPGDLGGVADRYFVTERYAPWSALWKGAEKTGEITALTLRMIWKMVRLEVSLDNLSGPIGIAEYAGVSAQSGLSRFLEFLGIVSVSLGILNLLPIPLLDGGHLFYYAVEFIRGRPVSETTLMVGQRLGIALLVGLMGFALYNDLARLLGY